MRCGSGLSKGLCLICKNNQNSLNDSPSISENSSQSPPHINHHCCYECGDPLDGIFCKRCTCKSCGKDAHIGYNCPPKVLVISNLNLAKIEPLMSSHKLCQVLVRHAVLEIKVHSLVIQLLTMSMNLLTFSTHLHNLLCILVNSARTMLVMVTIVHLKFRLSIQNRVTTKTLISYKDEDVPKKIYSNPLFDEEIIPMKIDPHHFNAESDLIESLLNNDSSIIPSSKIDSLFDEFADEITLLKSIPPGIEETDCYPEEETHFTKRLLYDNSSPRPPKEFISANSDTEIESFSPYPILVEDSDSFMEEIDLSFYSGLPNASGH
nr:hypothetical protein [Tanacetum cinerariifolium]